MLLATNTKTKKTTLLLPVIFHRCETRSLTLIEEHRLFQNRMHIAHMTELMNVYRFSKKYMKGRCYLEDQDVDRTKCNLILKK
jgi:hypothetical protein